MTPPVARMTYFVGELSGNDILGRRIGDRLPPRAATTLLVDERLMNLQREFHTKSPIDYLKAISYSVPRPLLSPLH